jgi:hypothetical protein
VIGQVPLSLSTHGTSLLVPASEVRRLCFERQVYLEVCLEPGSQLGGQTLYGRVPGSLYGCGLQVTQAQVARQAGSLCDVPAGRLSFVSSLFDVHDSWSGQLVCWAGGCSTLPGPARNGVGLGKGGYACSWALPAQARAGLVVEGGAPQTSLALLSVWKRFCVGPDAAAGQQKGSPLGLTAAAGQGRGFPCGCWGPCALNCHRWCVLAL